MTTTAASARSTASRETRWLGLRFEADAAVASESAAVLHGMRSGEGRPRELARLAAVAAYAATRRPDLSPAGARRARVLSPRRRREYLDENLLLAGAELIWRAGAHRDEKGHGLAHRTSGNGFALLKAFARSGDEHWLERARRLAVHALAQAERIAAAQRPPPATRSSRSTSAPPSSPPRASRSLLILASQSSTSCSRASQLQEAALHLVDLELTVAGQERVRRAAARAHRAAQERLAAVRSAHLPGARANARRAPGGRAEGRPRPRLGLRARDA